VPKVLFRKNSNARLKFLYKRSWCNLKDDTPAYFVTIAKSILRGGDQLSVLFPDLRPENPLKRRLQHIVEFNEFVMTKLKTGPLQVFGDNF
jgi:hypothetical protein